MKSSLKKNANKKHSTQVKIDKPLTSGAKKRISRRVLDENEEKACLYCFNFS